MVAGEGYAGEGFSYILKSIETVYKTRSGRGEIRRVNVNWAPLSIDEFRELKARVSVPTRFSRRLITRRPIPSCTHPAANAITPGAGLGAVERAMKAGIDDVGMGVLYDCTTGGSKSRSACRTSRRRVWSWTAHDKRAQAGTYGRLTGRLKSATPGERQRFS